MRITTLACAAVALAFAACENPTLASTAPASAPPSAPGPEAPSPGNASAAGANPLVLPSRHADRLAAPEVPPVVRDGVSYAQAEDGRAVGLSQSRGVLVASDAASGKQLWALAVYPDIVDAAREADVQWVFFKRMSFDPDGRLRVVNEHGKAFLVDVKHRSVTSTP